MAKKEEESKGKGATKTTKQGKSSETSKRKPRSSGEVKGPMGVGGKKKPETKAKVKEPSKVNHPSKARSAREENEGAKLDDQREEEQSKEPQESSFQQLPRPKKKLTEKTSEGEEHLVVIESQQEEKSKRQRKEASPPASSKKDPLERKEKEERKEEGKEVKGPAKKMSRRKSIKGISAEEKMKLDNTSKKEDLKNKAKATAKDLFKTIVPDKETQKEMGDLAKSILPDEEQVRKTADTITQNLTPDLAKLDELIDKLPEQDLKEQIKAQIDFLRKKRKTYNSGNDKGGISEEPVNPSLIPKYHQEAQEVINLLNKLHKKDTSTSNTKHEATDLEWIDANDPDNSIISLLKKGETLKDTILIISNLTPFPKESYRLGLPEPGKWKAIFTSDNNSVGGSGLRTKIIQAKSLPAHGKDFSIEINLPPMAVTYLKAEI